MTRFHHLFDPRGAFDHPVTTYLVAIIVVALVVASILIRILNNRKSISKETYRELLARVRSWYLLSAAMIVPILLGAGWVMGSTLLLSLFCFREFSKATGLNKSKSATISVIVSILITYFAVFDNWRELFSASWPLGICLILIVSLLPDNPQGFLRRVSLAIIGYSLLGISLGHLAFLANDSLYRPMLLWILICTELNDIFAYITGKMFGKRKLLVNTSPNKTSAGAIGAVVTTTLVSILVSHFVFLGTNLDQFSHLLTMGLMISVLGQCGDLLISSIKRDIGVKDMSNTLPGHGGLLDRFDSLLLVTPFLFYYLSYFKSDGIGSDQTVRLLSSGW